MSSHNPATTTSSSPSLQKQQPAAIPSQPFESFPDELLLFIFKHLSSFQRALLLPTCKSWNRFILLNAQLWNTLTIPHGLPIDLVLTILEVFNSRSNSKLKQVVIETLIEEQEELDLILEELKKSAETLLVVAFVQHDKLNGKTRKFAIQSFPMLEALFTKFSLEEIQNSSAYISTLKRKYGIRSVKEGKSELKFYVSDSLLDFDDDDLKWLSRVVYLEVCKTDSVPSLHKILQATQSLLELPLLYWSTADEETQDYDPHSLQELGLIKIKSLRELILPYRRKSTKSLLCFFEVDGDEVTVGAMSHSFLDFKGKDLKSILIFVYHATLQIENEVLWEEAVEETIFIMEQNTRVENLLFVCPTFQNQEDRKHLDLFLQKLGTTVRSAAEDVGPTKEKVSVGVESVLFPNLERLQIKNPSLLDWDLLKSTLNFRKLHNPNFQLELLDDWTSEVIEDWQKLGG